MPGNPEKSQKTMLLGAGIGIEVRSGNHNNLGTGVIMIKYY
jgi:hypothetical protein